MTKTAILQVADQGPLESLVLMLRSAGYDCYLPSPGLRTDLRSLGCELVLAPEDLTRSLGYDPPMDLPRADRFDMDNCDLFVDIKAHRNGPRVWDRWPRLRDRTLWYRINGGKPEHVVNQRGDMGDEVNLACPILTPNQWYRYDPTDNRQFDGDIWSGPCSKLGSEPGGSWTSCEDKKNWFGHAYVCWPPFHRAGDYAKLRWTNPPVSAAPLYSVCFIHNLAGWGYGAMAAPMMDLGVKMYGAGSPDGLVTHDRVPDLLSQALAMVHLKSSDAPGYALYEAMAAACPIICSRRLIWRNDMGDLLIPGITCLVFDRETHDPLTEADVCRCTAEIADHLRYLRDPHNSHRIGQAARERLHTATWRDTGPDCMDVLSFRKFMERHFGK